jgi:hypothetical protein
MYCKSDKHCPDWHSVIVQYDGDGCYVDVNCIRCGLSGCVGTHETLLDGIQWGNEGEGGPCKCQTCVG